MIKKFILIITIIFLQFSNLEINANDAQKQQQVWDSASPEAKQRVMDEFGLSEQELQNNLSDWQIWPITQALADANRDLDPNNLSSPNYMIDTNNLGLGTSLKRNTAEDTTENVLAQIVNKMLIALWSLALFMMTLGWWYMIFSHWNDEILGRWKALIIAWIVSIVVALSAWIIMRVTIYLLYS